MTQTRRAARKPTASSRQNHACPSRLPTTLGSGWFRTTRLAVAALMLLVPLFAHAAVIHVDGGAGGANDGTSWTDAYTDLQDGLADAESGDEIWVAAGVYKPTDGTDRTATFELKNGVEIYGGFAGTESQRDERDPEANVTVLSGDIDNNDAIDSDGVVILPDRINGENSFHVTTGSGTNGSAVLDGFTITAGLANGADDSDKSGAGMYNRNGDPTLSNLAFSGNSSEFDGGGMFNDGGDPTLGDVTFAGNGAHRGGGMRNNNSSLSVTNVVFNDNHAGLEGGGMFNFQSSPTLTDVNFSANSASSNGGGMANDGSSPTLTNVIFIGNSAQGAAGNGGGMSNGGSDPTLTNVSFRGNRAGNSGGGMHSSDSSPDLTNVSFSGNRAEGQESSDGDGGGMFNWSSSSTLTNVSFSGNRAEGQGGGMNNSSGSAGSESSSPAIRNTIFWNNEDNSGTDTPTASIANGEDDSPTISHSLVQGCNVGGAWIGDCGVDSGDNLDDADPLFVDTPDPVDAPTAAGDLRLQAGSPAIDAGDDAANDADADLDGRARITGDAIDLGPFEKLSTNCPDVGVRFVDRNASGPDDGESWETAYRDLQDALAVTEPCEIWVAAGVYKPSNDDRFATFNLINGVEIYGGFAGAEIDRDERDPDANVTVLSGDLVFSGPSFHVVTAYVTDESAVLDGFTITAGAASRDTGVEDRGGGMLIIDADPTLANLIISNNFASLTGGGIFNRKGDPTLTNITFTGNSAEIGGGMSNDDGGSPTLTNVVFNDNSADSPTSGQGGGMINWAGSPTLTNVTFTGNFAQTAGGGLFTWTDSDSTLTNVTFSGNSAGTDGGGMANSHQSHATLTNVTFSGNSAGSDGGGIFNQFDSSLDIRNTIFWNNQDSSGTNTAAASIVNESNSSATISHSLVQGQNPAGTGNLDGTNTDNNPDFIAPVDPATAPTAAGDLRLQVDSGSPAIDVGNNADNDTSTDLAGNVRIVNTTIDLGAYEIVAPSCPDDGMLFVDRNADQPGDGRGWDSAFRNLHYALAVTEPCEVWVAEGVYKPTDSTARTVAYELANGVGLYGGFEGTETQRNERDPKANVTVLSGDVDNNDIVNADGVVDHATDIAGSNSYNVVTGIGMDDTATLDGFTVTAGNANSPDGAPHDRGGGMWNRNGTPTLTNVTFSGNSARTHGGGIFHDGAGGPALTGVVFSGNRADHGGGMSTRTKFAEPTLTNVSFRNNRGGFGGGMSNVFGSPILNNVTFSGNSVSSDGGGMANKGGSPTLTNVAFSGNRADSSAGGGLFNSASNLVLTNVVFSGNNASQGGGMWHDSKLEIRNTIFWNNQDSSGLGTVSASIFSGSNLEDFQTISYSLVQGCNPDGDWNPDCGTADGTNLDDADPLFVDTPDPSSAPTTAGDVRLLARSPAVDAGNDAFFSDITTATDLDGNDRLFGDSVDLGPFETVYLLLDLSTAGDGQGSAIAEEPPRFAPGETVNVEAVPAQSSVFDGWTGDLTSTDNPLVFTINTDTALTANFTLKNFEVTAAASGSGTIDPASQTVDYDGTVSFTVTADTGGSVASVTGDTCNPVHTGGTTWEAANIQADCAVEASFSINSYNIGGTVSGLEGNGLELALNGGIEILPIAGNGTYQFSTQLDHDTDYAVTVESQPTDPNQTCTVANASGTVNAADADDIDVVCSTDTFTVGGAVSGLEGSGLVLQNNGGDDLTISANGAFTFATPLADGSDYEVTMLTQPDGQQCTVAQGTGTLAGDNVTSVEVDCSTIVIALDTGEIDFGALPFGESDSRSVTIRNAGDPDVVIERFVVPESPFTFDPGSCAPLPRTLASGETCTVDVGFDPTLLGEFSDALEIESNADSSPDSVALRGTVTAIAVPVLGPLGLLLLMVLTGIAVRPALQRL